MPSAIQDSWKLTVYCELSCLCLSVCVSVFLLCLVCICAIQGSWKLFVFCDLSLFVCACLSECDVPVPGIPSTGNFNFFWWYRIRYRNKMVLVKSLGTGIIKNWYRKKVSVKSGTGKKSIGIGIVQHFGYRHTLLSVFHCICVCVIQDSQKFTVYYEFSLYVRHG